MSIVKSEKTQSDYTKYLESLPKKRMSAGAIFLDGKGKVLLLKPTYKETWLIPGGVVEKDESPREACEREVLEEIGLEIAAEKLLVISYGKATAEKSESLQFIFFGSVLDDEAIRKIVLDNREISTFSFCEVGEIEKYLVESSKRKVLKSIEALEKNNTIYIEV